MAGLSRPSTVSVLSCARGNLYVTIFAMAFTVVEYVREDGSSPFGRWFDSLDPQAAAKVATARARLELGNTSNVKRIGAISEYQIDWGPGYRIYLSIEGDTLIILLGGGTKRGQRSDIRRAQELFEEYRRRRRSMGI
jgi:putative addiction module killer protein